jgi:PAS domain S-box-containing protein
VSPQTSPLSDAFNSAIARWVCEFAHQGVMITDDHLVVRSWNAWLESHTGYTAASVLGRPLLEAFPDLEARGFDAYYRSALRGEIKVLAHGFHRYVIPPRGRDVREVRQSGRIAPLLEGGVAVGTLTVIEDVSERIATERELRTQIEASERSRAFAEEALRVKDEFLATLSHEMRTPLNAVIGWTHMLRATPMDAARMARALEVIHRNAMAQIRLIDDMLDTARITTGKLRLDFQPVDLRRVALAAVDVVSPTAEAKDIAVVAHLPPSVMPIMGDPDRLQQVVWNLLVNAIKFTPNGGRVTMSTDEADGLLRLSVADTGEGISPEFLPRLFERFQQADSAANRRHAGLGLGLSLVRQLVELHGGQVSVTSTPGQGSVFTVSFPSRADLAPVAGVGVADVAPDADGAALAAIRVLVIADDHDARDMLAITLEQQAATVVSVASVADGLAVIANDRRFDVIVASVLHDHPDVRLLDALEMLSTRPGGNAIPAIAITSHQHSELEARLMAAGYDVRLARPVSPPALVSAVLDLVAR